MKNPIPNVGDNLTLAFSKIEMPDKVPEGAVKRKLAQDRTFELELFNQAEMRELRNDFRMKLRSRGATASEKEIDETFDNLMKRVAQKIDKDYSVEGLGHVIGEDARARGVDKKDSQEWFYVVQWPTGQKIREQLGFTKAHFHVTVGYTGNGVNEYAKDDSTILDSDEIKRKSTGVTSLFSKNNKNG